MKVDQKLFDAVKILRTNGATIAETAKYMKISDATVKMITAAETYEEYRNMITATVLKKKEQRAAKKAENKPEEPQQIVQVVEHRQSVQIQATEYMMRELKQTNEYLRIISNKMAAIIDDLYGTGVKK